jgi:hypothetical protein
MAAPRKYRDEVRERAIRLVCDLVDDDPDGMTVTGASRNVGLKPAAFAAVAATMLT